MLTDSLRRELLDAPVVAFDTETTGLNWLTDRVFGYALSWYGAEGKVKSIYVDLRTDKGALRWTRDTIPNLQYIVNHHMKFDVHMSRESGILLPLDRIDCTMIRENLLDEHRFEYSLDSVSFDRLGRRKVDIWPRLSEIFGGKPTKDEQAKNLQRAPREVVAEYAPVDSELALLIWEAQQQEIIDQGLDRVAEMERSLLQVVIEMERGGVRVDLPAAEKAAEYLDREVVVMQKQLDSLAGGPVNANSGPQVKKLLNVHQDEAGDWRTGDGLLLEPTASGKSGALKTDKLYRSALPAARLVADIRGFIKARDVFLRKYVLGMSKNGYVHASINQTKTEEGDGTYTGRLSITEPALQQIHKRNKKLAAIVRACFIPDEGCEWGCYDWSQMDFRVMASYANDEAIIAAYRADPKTDFHSLVAKLTGLPRDRDEKTGGANAKQMNLGLAFNMGAGRMAKEMNLPFVTEEEVDRRTGKKTGRIFFKAGPEAQEKFDLYHSTIPGPSRLKKSVASVATSRGYITTPLGRRLRFHKNTAYKSSGILYQSVAAEALKVKMVELGQYFRAYPERGRYMITVHDEHDCSLRIGRQAETDEEIRNILQTFDGVQCPIRFRVPILSDFGKGINWFEASR